MSLRVHIVDMRHVQDNYNFILRDEENNLTAVIDPSEAPAMQRYLDAKGWRLDMILNTHHHWDHVNGNIGLKQRYGCEIIGFAGDAARIPAIDRRLDANEPVMFGEHRIDTFCIDGHTIGHIAYYLAQDNIAQDNALFCGDTVFAMGCGRMFEGTAEQYLASIETIAALPDETRIYAAHEYTIPNGRFARTIEPDNTAIAERIETAKQLLRRGHPTIPTSVAAEKATNPYWRTGNAEIRERLGLRHAMSHEVFAEIRRRKDCF